MSKYCYTAILYGNNEYFLGALMLGFTLSKINSSYDKLLMVTPDTPENQRNILQKYFIIKEVPYIYINDNIFVDKNTRFKEVFTKLNLFKLTQYDKIIILDLDMFVLHNMDHLFELPAPAAKYRDRTMNLGFGEKIPNNLIKIKNGRIHNGINAGLMLLEPSEQEFNDIFKELDTKLPYKLKSSEQDYLGYRYRNKWTNIDARYNCQFTIKEEMFPSNYTIHDIYNLHYSWILNPWELVNINKKKVMTILVNTDRDITYYTLWVHHFRIIEKIFNDVGINIKESYIYSNNLSKRIDELYEQVKNLK